MSLRINIVRIRLDDIIAEMESLGEDTAAYLEKNSGRIVHVTDESMYIVEEGDEATAPAWMKEILEDTKTYLANLDNFLALPDKFDVNEWEIMDDFTCQIETPEVSALLSSSLPGKGAFRRFKDTLCNTGLEERWYKFRGEALRRFAMDWCEACGIQV